MKTKKKSVVSAALIIALCAVLLIVFLPDIRQFFDKAGTYGYTEKDLQNVDNIVLLAHCAEISGSSNSVAGFKEAVRTGADAVAVDLCFRPDGTPVITDDYDSVDSAPLLEELFKAMNTEKYLDTKVFLNITQLSGLSVFNKLVLDYGLESRLLIFGIDEEHYELIKADDTIVPVYYNYKVTQENKNSMSDGTFEAPEIMEKYGAGGLVIDYSDCSEKVIDAFDELGIPVVVSGVNTNSRFCSALVSNAKTVYVSDVENSRQLLDDWIAAMQERYRSSVEKSLEDLSKTNKK